MEKKDKVLWLDGLKGLACMGVFAHHFMLAFFPASYYGTGAKSLLNGFDTALATAPFGALINGNFWVCLFILISAYLAARSIMRSPDEKKGERAGSIVLRRYPRLLIPVLAVCVLKFVLIHVLDKLGWNYIGAVLPYGLKDWLKHSVILVFFTQDDTLIGPLWTIHYLFFGVLLAVLLALPAKKARPWMILVYVLLLYPAAILNVHYTSAILGVFLADIEVFERLGKLSEKLRLRDRRALSAVLAALLIVLGGFIGGYPSYAEPENIYRLLTPFVHLFGRVTDTPAEFMHACGAFVMMLGILYWNRLSMPSVLSTKVMRYLGSICLGVFLLHILWIEQLGYYLNDLLVSKLWSRAGAGAIVFVILTALLIASSELFCRVLRQKK